MWYLPSRVTNVLRLNPFSDPFSGHVTGLARWGLGLEVGAKLFLEAEVFLNWMKIPAKWSWQP